MTGAKEQRGEHRERDDQPEQLLVFDPEEWAAVKQNVAQGSATKGGDEGDEHNAEDVELFASGFDEARCREGENTDYLEHAKCRSNQLPLLDWVHD